MKIESVSQKADRAGQYYLKLSDGCVLRLYPQTVAEFHLYAGRELEAEEPDRKELQKTIDALLRRGFAWQDIRRCLAQRGESVDGEPEE